MKKNVLIHAIIACAAILSAAAFPACDTSGAELVDYTKSWEHKALQLQRGLDLDAPLPQATFIGTHNSYNAKAYTTAVSYIDPNHIYPLYDQLSLDCRAIELDMHWYFSMQGAPWNWRHRPLLSHAQGNHVGASAFDRPIEEGLDEINYWLREPDNAGEVLIIYIEEHLDGHFKETADIINSYFGDLIYRPGGSCQGIPMNISKMDVLNAGKQVIIVGDGCRNADWHSIAFAGVGDRTGSVYVTGTNSNFKPYPDCGSGGVSPADYNKYLVRYYEDRTWLTSHFGKPDKYIEPADVVAFLKCGANILGMDKLTPTDGRLKSAVWSWAEGEPNNANNSESSAMQLENGRFNDANPSLEYPFACKNRATGQWYVTNGAGSWDDGVSLCASETGGQFQFAVPSSSRDNQKLVDAKLAKRVKEVWLNYFAAGASSAPACRQKCEYVNKGGAIKKKCATICGAAPAKTWVSGYGSSYVTQPVRKTVKVFQNCNYGGYAKSLAPGNYNMNDILANGIRNDDLSSIQVPAGMKVVMYEHADYAGRSWTVTKNTACFVDIGANDVVSSMKVMMTP